MSPSAHKMQCPITGIGVIRFALSCSAFVNFWRKRAALGAHIVRFASAAIVYQSLSDAKALPLEWILDPGKRRSLSDRVMARLVQAGVCAETTDEKQELRQAFIAVSLAAQGSPIPFIEASYICYGLHPERVWLAILHNRAVRLGVAMPKKTCASERIAPRKKAA